MSDRVKVNDRGMEVKKPFTFANLGVDNVGPQDVLESDSTFTYIEGQYNPSILAPLDNVYDPLVKHEVLVSDYLHMVGNPNEVEYRANNRRIADALIRRAIAAISQNILLIYKNGFDSFVEPFIINKNDDKYMPPINDGIDIYLITFKEIFKDRSDYELLKPYIAHEPFNFTSNTQDEVLNNCLDVIGKITSRVACNYNDLINTYINLDKLDIEAFAKFILESEDVDFETVDKTQYIGTVLGALNQVAVEDIGKVREIVEVELMQASSEFFRVYNKDIDLGKFKTIRDQKR